ncbi:putative ubiquitin-conjugating enzyme E2 [Trifolium repens]|nr:putative ubiquitin-conjugating enzyme E2 [Trifolium repens]
MDLMRVVIIGAEGTPYHDGLFFFDVLFPSDYPNVPPRSRAQSEFEAQSLKYNENTFILSVRTMMYMMKKPPKNFEVLVMGHFYSQAHDILASCKAYMEGVQVGCFVKGEVRDVDKGGRKSSDRFKADLFGYVKLLVQDFEKIGVKDC